VAQPQQLRRLAAGDWVLACNAAAAVSPGLGKLSGGDYEGRTLVRARVEFPSGVRTVVPGDLRRVTPEDEATLVEHALSAGLVPTPARRALERALEAMRSGEQRYVRTPGLLDRLWVVFRDSGEDRCPGLAELFESGLAELQPILLAGRPQPVPLAWPVVEPLPPGPRPAVRSQSEEEPAVRERSPRAAAPRATPGSPTVRAKEPAAPQQSGAVQARLGHSGSHATLEQQKAYVFGLVESGVHLSWEALLDLRRYDLEAMRGYLRARVSVEDLELAHRFGSNVAAQVLERPARKRVLTYRERSLSAFEVAFEGRWRPALAYHYLSLADLLSGWCVRGPAGRTIGYGFAPVLDPVGAWLNDGSELESELAATWVHAVDTVSQRLGTRFPAWHGDIGSLRRALGALAEACAPLPPHAAEHDVRWGRVLALVDPVYDAIRALHSEARNMRQQVRWVEVRAGDGLIRWLLAGEWAHPW